MLTRRMHAVKRTAVHSVPPHDGVVARKVDGMAPRRSALLGRHVGDFVVEELHILAPTPVVRHAPEHAMAAAVANDVVFQADMAGRTHPDAGAVAAPVNGQALRD